MIDTTHLFRPNLWVTEVKGRNKEVIRKRVILKSKDREQSEPICELIHFLKRALKGTECTPPRVTSVTPSSHVHVMAKSWLCGHTAWG